MNPLISIIVPIYNAEKYLAKCIQSLIHQTYTALQIILIDDGSTDSSLSIAQQYAGQDSRIIVYSQANQGQSAARNKGLEYANGEYISFIDADDYIDTNFYETLLQSIEGHDCVQIGYKRVSPMDDILLTKQPHHFYQFTSPCMRLYRHTVFTHHNLQFPTGMIYEDVVFSLDFWACNPSYTILSYTGYNYTKNTLSTTAKRNCSQEKLLFDSLYKKFRHASNFKQRAIIFYTIIRLKFHFLQYD